jgi:hypothetical protein
VTAPDASSEARYVRICNALWDVLSCTREGRQRVLDALPPYERVVLAETAGPAIELELVRRRKTMSTVLLPIFPVTYFAFVAREGADGVLRLLESRAWRERRPQPGSSFPPAASTSEAFVQYLDVIGWPARQYHWVREAFAFERAYLFGGPTPPGRRIDGATVRLAESAWVAEASFDVPAMGQALLEQGRCDPWEDALALLKPPPAPHAVLCVPRAGRIRRVRLSGPALAALRWVWDGAVAVPHGAVARPGFLRMRDAGLVQTAAS